MNLNDCLLFKLTRAKNAANSYFKDCLSEINISPDQFYILKTLNDTKIYTPSGLSEALNLNNSTITNQISKLESEGYLVRRFSTRDRRSVPILLTQKGRTIAIKYDKIAEEASKVWFEGISEDEQAQLYRLLDLIFEKNMDAIVNKKTPIHVEPLPTPVDRW